MGFLNPLFLVAAVAVAVPILIHLLHLRSGRRRPFPALRYLRRTEKEHARRIRLRQILLLLLRVAAILLLVAAGARLFLRGRGSDHEATALAIVLDNSLSSGVVIGDRRVLDILKTAALESIDAATPEDRVWVLRAGEPWETPVPGTPEEARRRIVDTQPEGSAASLPAVVERARSLVSAAGMAASEVQVLSDLQATAFPDSAGARAPAGNVPALVLVPPGSPPANRFVASVEVGGGLPPLLNQATRIAVRVGSSPAPGAGGGEEAASVPDTTRIRLVVDGRMTAAADAPAGQTVLMGAGPFALGEVTGAVEIDPDALRTDDRRYFAFRVRPPPRVAVVGEAGVFLDQALGVLTDAGRVARSDSSDADVLVAGTGEGLGDGPEGIPAIVLPPDDPALLPAVNRRLRDGGVPWRLEADTAEGEARLSAVDLPVSLDSVRVSRAYRLRSVGSAAGDVLIRLETGEPWMVDTRSASGRHLLLVASPLVPESTTLPVSPEMLPLVEWMVSGWAPSFRTTPAVTAGEPLLLPAEATKVRSPDGTLTSVDGRQPFHATGTPGIYDVLDGDSVVARMAVNPPTDESLLRRLGSDEILRRIAPPVRVVPDPDDWASRVFLRRRGGEPWRPLLLAALVILLVEGILAAGGGRGRAAEKDGRVGSQERVKRRRADVS